MPMERSRASGKFILYFRNRGSKINSTKDGIIRTSIEWESRVILSMSLVSIYNQMKERMDIKGIDASNAPIEVYFLEISEIKNIVRVDIAIFII